MFLMMMKGFVPKNLIVVSKSLEFMEDCTSVLYNPIIHGVISVFICTRKKNCTGKC